jgi:tRNA pseudouridine38-40 synthase
MLVKMPRYKFTIEYDGTPYCGWQSQPNLPTVQDQIQKAISQITQSTCELQVAGRTDAGVHALEQVAHTDLSIQLEPSRFTYGINHFLKKKGIAIIKTEIVDESFHARFTAKSRLYVYSIINRSAPLSLHQYRAYHVPKPLNVLLMNEAAQLLLGHHDFTTFRASECQALSPMKTIDVARFEQIQDRITFIIQSKSFLHHQVRNIVGTLCLVGREKWSIDDFRQALLAKDRKRGGPTAPAHGLYLKQVLY